MKCVKYGMVLSFLLSVGCTEHTLEDGGPVNPALEPPYLGWNSYDSYGNEITEQQFLDNLHHFKAVLMPKGYKYFVIDAGWDDIHIDPQFDTFGRPVASEKFFPSGMKAMADSVHANGGLFGIWMARGINRKAYHENLEVEGTSYRLQDIGDVNDTSDWWPYNYGVNMSKPGAQEYYNSVIMQLAGWGVDFIKYDDMIPHPEEIKAVRRAIDNCGRKIILSLSPGDKADLMDFEVLKLANMVRITSDVWDRQEDIDKGFERWNDLGPLASNNSVRLDLDMIPFGRIKRPFDRMDEFSADQKKSFMTQRAMAASPLFFGGEIGQTDSVSISIVTNSEMLYCNQNCAVGYRVFDIGSPSIDVWRSNHVSNPNEFWLGIFNRSPRDSFYTVDNSDVGKNALIYDIWEGKKIEYSGRYSFTIPKYGVKFLKVQKR